MKGLTRIVLVGRSPLSFFIARELDRYLGPLVQYQLIWLTDNRELLLDIGSLFQKNGPITVKVARSLTDVQVKAGSVRSINLRTKEITTSQSTVSYDYLILDQLPYYSLSDFLTIKQQVGQLLLALGATKRSANLHVGGSNATSWELALLVRAHQLATQPDSARTLQITTDHPTILSIGSFLRELGIGQRSASRTAGLRLGAPMAMVAASKIKGALLDKSGHLITDAFLRVKGFDNVIALDTPELYRSNIHHGYQTLARQLARSFSSLIESSFKTAFQLPKTQLLLAPDQAKLLVFGEVTSKNFRAGLVHAFERLLKRRLATK